VSSIVLEYRSVEVVMSVAADMTVSVEVSVSTLTRVVVRMSMAVFVFDGPFSVVEVVLYIVEVL
jgi:hypothetical protein